MLGLLGGVGRPGPRGSTGVPYNIGPGTFSGILARAQVGSLSTATDAGGVIQYYAADIARFNGAAQRLLIEGQQTGLMLQSGNLASGSWNVEQLAISAAGVTGPDGVTGGFVLTQSGVVARKIVYQFITNAPSAAAVVRAYLRAGTNRYVNLLLDLSGNYATMQIDTQTWTFTTGVNGVGFIIGTPRIIPLANGWYECVFVCGLTTVSNYVVFLSPASVGNYQLDSAALLPAGETTICWAFQANEGSQAGSYVPTTTAALTRGRDVATLAGQTGARTVTGVCMIPQNAPAGVQQVIWSFDDGTDNNRYTIRNSPAGAVIQALRVTAGVAVVSTDLGSMTAGTPFRFGMTIDGAGAGIAAIGTGPVQTIAGGPTVNTTGRAGSIVAAGVELFGELGNARSTAGVVTGPELLARMAATPLT